jgi:hypothetical protein
VTLVSVGGFELRSPASEAGAFAGLSYTLLEMRPDPQGQRSLKAAPALAHGDERQIVLSAGHGVLHRLVGKGRVERRARRPGYSRHPAPGR